MNGLFKELKRRNVFRVGAAYIVGGWILIQVADALFPALNLPAWTTRFVAGLVVLGFPVSLVLAWAFELTPDGVRRDLGAGNESTAGRRLDIATLIGVMIVIAIAGFEQTREETPRVEVTGQPESGASPSVAVLAFDNMSPDPANAFFAEGISEEILNVLAGIEGLRVASRTSAFSFAETDTPIPEIASQLNVNHVLEGSVRKQDTKVRITAQLIEAQSDKHIWSATYDRDLTDIFEIQEEIAGAISDALMSALGMSPVTVIAPTDDLVAYELFLSGRQHYYQRYTALLRAIVDLEAAVARDPDFAAAWSYLAAAHWVIVSYPIEPASRKDERYARALEAADNALRLDPGQALAFAVRGRVARDEQSWLVGMEINSQAAAMAPQDTSILMWAGSDLFLAGYPEESLPYLERAVELDPLTSINVGSLGMAYLALGRRDEARELMHRSIELGWVNPWLPLAQDYLHTGEPDKARQILLTTIDVLDRSAEARAVLRDMWNGIIDGNLSGEDIQKVQVESMPGYAITSLTHPFLAIGDIERLFDAWNTAEDYVVIYGNRLAFSPAGRVVAEHPRFLEIAARQRLFPVWEAKGYPMGCDLVEDDAGRHLSCPNWPD